MAFNNCHDRDSWFAVDVELRADRPDAGVATAHDEGALWILRYFEQPLPFQKLNRALTAREAYLQTGAGIELDAGAIGERDRALFADASRVHSGTRERPAECRGDAEGRDGGGDPVAARSSRSCRRTRRYWRGTLEFDDV